MWDLRTTTNVSDEFQRLFGWTIDEKPWRKRKCLLDGITLIRPFNSEANGDAATVLSQGVSNQSHFFNFTICCAYIVSALAVSKSVMQEIACIALEFGCVDSNSTNWIMISQCIIVKDTQKEQRRRVQNIESKCPSRPRHPQWVKAVVDDVRPNQTILKDYGRK